MKETVMMKKVKSWHRELFLKRDGHAWSMQKYILKILLKLLKKATLPQQLMQYFFVNCDIDDTNLLCNKLL